MMQLRLTTALLLLTAWALGGDAEVVLVDGTKISNAKLVGGDKNAVQLVVDSKKQTVPTTRLVSIHLGDAPSTPTTQPFHLYLRNGDRLRGTVKGTGDAVTMEGGEFSGFSFPLEEVRAVRIGTLVAGMREKYNEAFLRELKKGRDVVIVQQDAKPFPFAARVLEFNDAAITVRIGQDKRTLERRKVYGFILSGEQTTPPKGQGITRIHLARGGRLTLPMEEITATAIKTPRGVIARTRTVVQGETRTQERHVLAIEFTGGHFAHLGDMVPLDVKTRALFGAGPAPRTHRMVHGNGMQISGRRFAFGVGVAAYTRMEYTLSSRWKSFYVACGIDDEAGPEGNATFRVIGDGKILKEVTRRRGEAAVAFVLDVSGVDRLVLETDPGESYISDFCNWADAKVFGPAR